MKTSSATDWKWLHDKTSPSVCSWQQTFVESWS